MSHHHHPSTSASENHGIDAKKMNDVEKLKILLPHWMEHNEEHAASFESWAKTMRSTGREDLAVALEKISREARTLQHLFQEAMKLV
jgi:hypothetical protein